MKISYNREHPARRLHIRIGDRLQHIEEDKYVVTIVGWGNCDEVWHQLSNRTCGSSHCPNAYTIIEVREKNEQGSLGWCNTGYWCLQHEGGPPSWRKLRKWTNCAEKRL